MVKTEYLLIGSRSKINKFTSEPNIVINNRPIKRVTEMKSLGILIDQFLSWDSHLDELCKKVAAGLGAIKRLRPYFNPSIMLWFNRILTIAVLCGIQLVPCLQIDYKDSKIWQQGSS